MDKVDDVELSQSALSRISRDRSNRTSDEKVAGRGLLSLILGCLIVFVVDNEAMAYTDFDRKILITEFGGLRFIKNIDVVDVAINEYSNLLFPTPSNGIKIVQESKRDIFARVQNGDRPIDGEVSTFFLIGKFEIIWKNTVSAIQPIDIQPSAYIISRCSTSVFNRDSNRIRIGLFKFWMASADVCSQFAAGGYPASARLLHRN